MVKEAARANYELGLLDKDIKNAIILAVMNANENGKINLL
jgi:aspartate ammonia-lyase